MSDDEDDPFLMPLSQAVNHSDYALGAAAMQATEALGTQAGAPATNKRSGKIFNDPVHGHIYLPGMACQVIDTPEFQRLRDLKQLGTTYMVFPGAAHNRFEHSLGTCHLAGNVLMHLRRIHRKEDLGGGIERRDHTVVSLAGLCHDLGHGPFSHVFDREFLPRRLGEVEAEKWSHEAMSGDMLDYLVDQHSIDLPKDVIDDVRHLISASHVENPVTPRSGTGKEKKFLTEIVANGRNSVDVDKFDYLQRDCRNCGLKNSCEFSRIMMYMRVIGDEICHKQSEVDNLYELFHTRASLHKRVYTHKTAKAIEFMVVDALTEADVVQNGRISNAIWSAEEFAQLDDTILREIERSRDPDMAKARALVKRIRTRNLYKFVNEFTVPRLYVDPPGGWKTVTPADIVACQKHDGTVPGGIREEDIIVQNQKIDFAMNGKNPVDSIHFYRDMFSSEKFTIPKDKVSTMLPEVFLERRIRVFCTREDQDDKYIRAIDEALKEYQLREYKQEAQVGPSATPLKMGRKRTASQLSLGGADDPGVL